MVALGSPWVRRSLHHITAVVWFLQQLPANYSLTVSFSHTSNASWRSLCPLMIISHIYVNKVAQQQLYTPGGSNIPFHQHINIYFHL